MQEKSKCLFMDGAMGTVLLESGVPLNSCFELLNLNRPSLISRIHQAYLRAGAQVLVANTFGANRRRLGAHGKEGRIMSINQAGVRIAKRVARQKAEVYASIGPLGGPLGSPHPSPKKCLSLFREQVEALEEVAPAGYLVETMTTLVEAKAAAMAVRTVSKRHLICLMTFPKRWNEVTKKELEEISKTLRDAGADVIGTNCGPGPKENFRVMEILRSVDAGELCARPSAGLPGSVRSPEEFAAWSAKFMALGCQWMGGCCGTTPKHIQAVQAAFKK